MTFAGTPQHEDQRWKKTFKEGCAVLFQSIEMLSKIAPVDVVVVAGNHDLDMAFCAGEVIWAKFFNNKNVVVDNSPTQRKYYRYGKCLIGFTHGKEEKISELPLIMANERSKDFHEAKFKEWHIGHVHHKKEYKFLSSEEFKGVTVRILRALTATDAWHNSKGYIGAGRAAEGFVWNKEQGLICNLSVNL
jgi:DNA repair exonuclease SbcCD nuclease subunit